MFYPPNIFCLLHLYALRHGKGWLTQKILAKPSNSFKFTGENELIQKSMCLRKLSARLACRRVTLIKNLFCLQYRFLNEPIFAIFYFFLKILCALLVCSVGSNFRAKNYEQKNLFEKIRPQPRNEDIKRDPKRGHIEEERSREFIVFTWVVCS